MRASGDDPADVFARAYQDVVDHWRVPAASARASTAFGRSHVLICGEENAPAVVLLPGHGATATAWRDVAAGLSPSHRVIAVDPPGQPAPAQPASPGPASGPGAPDQAATGRAPAGQPGQPGEPGPGVPGSRPVRTMADLTDWLDQILDALAVPRAALIGHSFGAHLAVQYALHAPGRVTRLALLDPTDTFAPLGLGYRLHAIPLLARPSAARMRRLLAWETQGLPVDEPWMAVVTAGADLGRSKIVIPRRPRPDQLAGLGQPVLVIVAGRSRAHDPQQISRRARELLPAVTTATLAQATHHTMPAAGARELLRYIEPFLT